MDGLTVQEVVERARSSVGSFYARFAGKDELLRYLEERVWAEAEERWDEALASSGWEELPVEDVVRGVVSLLVRTAGRDAARRAAFGGRSHGSEDGSGRAASFHRRVLADLRPLLLREGVGGGASDRDRALELGYWMIIGTLRLLYLPGSPVERTPPDRELAEGLTSAYLGYLGIGRSGGDPGSEVDFFDVWG